MFVRNLVLTLLTLTAGIGGTVAIVKMKPQAQKKAKRDLGILVQYQRFSAESQHALISGLGLVEAARSVNVISQVGGVLTELNDQLIIGGRLKIKDHLAQIDPTDYHLAVTEAKARVKIARQEVSLEEGRQKVAEREWKLMSRRKSKRSLEEGDAKDRVLRRPQGAIARANLSIAKSILRRAKVNLNRARLKVPFNAVVLSESVEIGQFVAPGTRMAQLAGTDAFWINTSVPSSELSWIDFPQHGDKGDARGSQALVKYDVGDRVIERTGYIVRQLTQIEPTGRMARVIVEVTDPLGLETEAPPLLLGAQVQVSLIGRPLGELIELPRSALRGASSVWIFEPENISAAERAPAEAASSSPEAPQPSQLQQLGTLRVKEVEIMRRRRDTVIVRAGLSSESLVITSNIATPVPNMRVRAAR